MGKSMSLVQTLESPKGMSGKNSGLWWLRTKNKVWPLFSLKLTILFKWCCEKICVLMRRGGGLDEREGRQKKDYIMTVAEELHEQDDKMTAAEG